MSKEKRFDKDALIVPVIRIIIIIIAVIIVMNIISSQGRFQNPPEEVQTISLVPSEVSVKILRAQGSFAIYGEVQGEKKLLTQACHSKIKLTRIEDLVNLEINDGNEENILITGVNIEEEFFIISIQVGDEIIQIW